MIHFISSCSKAQKYRECLGSYRYTLHILKLDIAQWNDSIIFVVFLCQFQSLGGFVSLGVVETHRAREIDKYLNHFRSLGWCTNKGNDISYGWRDEGSREKKTGLRTAEPIQVEINAKKTHQSLRTVASWKRASQAG